METTSIVIKFQFADNVIIKPNQNTFFIPKINNNLATPAIPHTSS